MQSGLALSDSSSPSNQSMFDSTSIKDNDFATSMIPAAAEAAAQAPTSMNFVPTYRFGEPTQFQTDAYPFPLLQWQPPPGFIQLGTDLTPVFPTLGYSFGGPQPIGNPCQYQCIPYNSMCISKSLAPSLKRKVEDGSGNSHTSQKMENFVGHVPGYFCHDSVLHAGFLPVQPVFQSPFFTPSVRGPALNYTLSIPLTENQEINVFPTFGAQRTENFVGGNASVPVQKRKVFHPSFLSSMNVSSNGNGTGELEASARHRSPPLRQHIVPTATEKETSFLVSKSSKTHCGYLPATDSSRFEHKKEIEKKGLMVLVQKELRNTDVGNLGRIVLPKKDAEANLPQLDAKEGIMLPMEDMTYSINWNFKYRYWTNNRSRMYLMENTGDFVRTHNLQIGDLFVVYKEESSGKYIARGKKAMRPLSVEGRAEGETRENGRVCTEEGSLVHRDGRRDFKVEPDAFVQGKSFDFDGESGRICQFIQPPKRELGAE